MFEALTPEATSNQLAALIRANHAELVERETRVLQLAAAWADVHDLDPTGVEYRPLIERACAWGGPGTPAVSEYCAVELGALQGTGEIAARMLIADALDLRHRFPRLWRQVQAGEVRAWQARKVAEATRALSWEAAQEIDDTLSGFLGQLAWPRFQRLLQAAILDADPEQAAERERRRREGRDVFAFDGEDGLQTLVAKAASGDVVWFMAMVNRLADILQADGDLDPVGVRRSRAIGLLAQPARALQLLRDHSRPAEEDPEPDADPEPDPHTSVDLEGPTDPLDPRLLRPQVVLHFHLSEASVQAGHGMVRPEHGEAITLAELREFLASTGCAVRVQPVLDPVGQAAVDEYEIPHRLRTSVRLRNPCDTFPYGVCTSAGMDLDHTVPYRPPDRGGPPGQTGLHNLGPLSRHHRRAVTHGRWQRRQPDPGTYLFRSPTGYVFLVTNHGTLDLGRTAYAHAIWDEAAPGAGATVRDPAAEPCRRPRVAHQRTAGLQQTGRPPAPPT